MRIPESVYEYFYNRLGDEYALIEGSRPVASLREEAKSYFGKDFTINTQQATDILEEIDKFNFHKVKAGDTYVGISGSDFMKLIAIFIEL